MRPYYCAGGITLYHADCREVVPSLGADVVICDPPYFLPAAHYSVRSGVSKSLGDLSILEHYFKGVFSELAEVTSPQGFAYVFCDGQSYPVFHRAGYSVFRKIRPLVWDKLTSVNGYGWRHQHELIMFCEMKDSPSIPTGDGDVLRFRAVPIGERSHLAQKPVDLLMTLVKKHDSGVILDPFCGSGSTLVAAAKLGRVAVGVEIEEKYCEIAANRLSTRIVGIEPAQVAIGPA